MTVVFGVLFIVILGLLFISRHIVLVCLIGLGTGVILSPLLNLFRKRFHIPRALSAVVFLMVFSLAVSAVLFLLWYLVSEQFHSLMARAPEIKQNLLNQQDQVFEKYPWIKNYFEDFAITEAAKRGALGIFKGMQVTLVALGGFLFALVIAMYTAVRANEYFESIVSLFPPHFRPKTKKVLLACASILRQWFRAQLLDMGIIGTLTGLGLWIVGVEYWAIFGLLTAVLGIIPYVGIIIVVVGAVLITLASDPAQVPWIVGVFFLTQQIESNLILPYVMRGQVKLPEVPLLIFMLIFGSWFGILGIFISPPLFAVLMTVYLQIYRPFIDTKSPVVAP